IEVAGLHLIDDVDAVEPAGLGGRIDNVGGVAHLREKPVLLCGKWRARDPRPRSAKGPAERRFQGPYGARFPHFQTGSPALPHFVAATRCSIAIQRREPSKAL